MHTKSAADVNYSPKIQCTEEKEALLTAGKNESIVNGGAIQYLQHWPT